MTGRPALPDPSADGTLDSLVVLVAESLGYSCRAVSGEVMLLEGPTRLHVGMRDLRQIARLIPRDDWPALVSDHITTLTTALEEPLDLWDFDLARHLLRTRLYQSAADIGGLAARPFAEGLIEAVVVDTPTAVRTVTGHEAAGWPVSADALFMLGRANVRDDGPLRVDEHDLGQVRVAVLSGWTAYTATHLAWLEEYLQIGAHGALVTVPNRSLVIVHPLRSSDPSPRVRYRAAATAAHELHSHARNAYEEGPGSLSPHVYWWRAGAMSRLDLRYQDGTAVLPEAFAAVIVGASRSERAEPL
ncbi:hypothetical protein [Actinomadura harenae]|uniref:Uncharacterized protein n=1 Tax=Actinomadura harenae TaxID=2483351 RepID=A0A3M2LGA7_9ACTN|nr:hypothetical protein [Actinomadura harenae]RMI36541.1 hypothetical protein EBO15_38370 [Actinomadura harenae]